MKNKRLISCAIIILFCLISSSSAPAVDPPSSDEAATQAERFKTEVEQRKEQVEKKAVKAPEIEIQEEAEKPAAAGPSFVLKDVKVTGATIFKPEDFRPLYEPYLGKEVAFKDIETIAGKIKGKYAQKGYITTIAYIPEQDIKEGVVEIRIVEGRLGEVKVEGNKWFSTSLINRYFHTKKNEVLNAWKLQRDLMRLNQNPDLEVKTVIAQGKEPGTSDITLQVKDKFPYHVGTSADNQGTRLVGKYRSAISSRSTNLLGFGDSAFANWSFSKSSTGLFVSYLVPVDTYGTKMGLDFTVFTMKLGEEYKPSDITGITQVYTPKVSGEIYLSDDFQANIETGLEIKSIKKAVIGNTTADDELRLPYISYDFTKMDSFFAGGQTTFSPKLTFSLENFLGGSSRAHPTSSRAATGGFFVKYEQTIRRIQRMPLESYLSMRSQFQVASRTLPSSEQFQLGGFYSIRGYPEGDFIGDSGTSLNLDWIFPMYIIPKEWKLPRSDAPLRQQIQPVVFLDMGSAKLTKPTASEDRKVKFLMGMGAGIKVQFNRNLFLQVAWAERLGDRPTQGSGPSNFHMSFQFEL